MPADPLGAPSAATAFRPPTPVIIGLLAGIAAGKTTVAGLFARHGLVHVDADQIGREVTAESATLAEIAAAFGPEVIVAGQLDRAAMADRVFGDAAARGRLEGIVLPRIRQRVLAALAAARTAGHSVLLDAPLLLEGGLIEHCDHVVFVATSPGTRRRRAAARGWSTDELERREAAQAPLPSKMARATHTIHNDGDLTETANQVATFLAGLPAQ